MIDGQNLEQRGTLLVKPLHWVKSRDGIYEISACATTSIGRYEAWHFLLPTDPPEDFYGWKGPFSEDWEAEDFEAAVAAAQADYLQRILGAIDLLALAGVSQDIHQWWHYPIEMPLTNDGNGPATVGVDAAKITYEVWDREMVSHGSFEHLSEAVNESMRLNSIHKGGAANTPDLSQGDEN